MDGQAGGLSKIGWCVTGVGDRWVFLTWAKSFDNLDEDNNNTDLDIEEINYSRRKNRNTIEEIACFSTVFAKPNNLELYWLHPCLSKSVTSHRNLSLSNRTHPWPYQLHSISATPSATPPAKHPSTQSTLHTPALPAVLLHHCQSSSPV